MPLKVKRKLARDHAMWPCIAHTARPIMITHNHIQVHIQIQLEQDRCEHVHGMWQCLELEYHGGVLGQCGDGTKGRAAENCPTWHKIAQSCLGKNKIAQNCLGKLQILVVC